ncbi:hypothetical protein FB567DRAFT_535278 [Paraphoma chrysanthemicola]|uniref:Uncharacterized protein n=1 Tax=Paraphoma chrysanthemicola TaxID=798071 RepID=A0A8K0QY81_9PLEO|nr:hypothetical protein FB567DRAFT_535278 [Paraphoma chrysanthemicola]
MDLPAIPSIVYPSITVTSDGAPEPTISACIFATAIAIFVYVCSPFILAIFGMILNTVSKTVVTIALLPLLGLMRLCNKLLGIRPAAAEDHTASCTKCSNIRADLEDNGEIEIDKLINDLDDLQRREESARIALDRAQSNHNTILAQVKGVGMLASGVGKALDHAIIPHARGTARPAAAYMNPVSANPPCLSEDPTGYIQWAQKELNRIKEEMAPDGDEAGLNIVIHVD